MDKLVAWTKMCFGVFVNEVSVIGCESIPLHVGYGKKDCVNYTIYMTTAYPFNFWNSSRFLKFSEILKFFEIADHMHAFTRIEFTVDDIVRSSLVKDYILAKIKHDDLDTAY